MPKEAAILVDTGPLVALFDKDDAFHALCREELQAIRSPLVTAWPVITEVIYLLSFSPRVQDDMWELILRGGLSLAELALADIPRIRELMRKYQDLPMDLADAFLVRLAERERLRTIFTVDHRDFRIYRPAHTRFFRLLPADLPPSLLRGLPYPLPPGL